jgi:hypothetical protein
MPTGQAKQITYWINGTLVDSFGNPLDSSYTPPASIPLVAYDEGASLGQVLGFNFFGAGVTATISGGVVLVNIPVISLADQTTAEQGSDNVAYLSALRLTQALAAVRAFATQAQALAATDNTTVMTPLRVKQYIDSLGLTGGGGSFGTYTVADYFAADYTV